MPAPLAPACHAAKARAATAALDREISAVPKSMAGATSGAGAGAGAGAGGGGGNTTEPAPPALPPALPPQPESISTSTPDPAKNRPDAPAAQTMSPLHFNSPELTAATTVPIELKSDNHIKSQENQSVSIFEYRLVSGRLKAATSATAHIAATYQKKPAS